MTLVKAALNLATLAAYGSPSEKAKVRFVAAGRESGFLCEE
jgi:hypothetical protein